MAQSVKHLPLPQVMILGVLGSSPTSGLPAQRGSLLLPPAAYTLSLLFSLK